jgi:hypothetical protein
VTLPAGRPTETILVEGDGAAPDVSLTGPGGVKISTAQAAKQGRALTLRGVPAIYFALRTPAGGRWIVTPNPGSVPVKRVLISDGFKPLGLRASLRGSGRNRTISYQVSHHGNGQSVQFAEHGTFGTRLIGKPVVRARGSVRFVPAATPARRRTLIAIISQDGIAQRQQKIATFTAPPLRSPRIPGRITARRGEHTLMLTWNRASGARRYIARLTGAHGTRLATLTRRTSVTFRAIRRDERIRIEVRGVAANGATGPAKTLTSRGR